MFSSIGKILEEKDKESRHEKKRLGAAGRESQRAMWFGRESVMPHRLIGGTNAMIKP